jgi:hypothetical protein
MSTSNIDEADLKTDTIEVDKDEDRNERFRNVLKTLDGAGFETVCLVLCNSLAVQIDYFVKDDIIEKFMDDFRSATLEALSKIRSRENTIH